MNDDLLWQTTQRHNDEEGPFFAQMEAANAATLTVVLALFTS